MISIVTINFNAANVTLRLIRSLSLQSDLDFQLYIIDNDSEGSDRKALRKAISDCPVAIELIESDINGGFSAGNNLGIRRAMDNGAQWIVLLNNDAVVSRDFIKCLREQLPSDPGIIGLPVQERERIARCGKVTWSAFTSPHVYAPSPTPTQAYAIGAALVVHRDVFSRIGFLDESYFLYFEDVEFSMRARSHAIPISFVSSPIVFHEPQTSTSTMGHALLLRYHIRNAIRFHRAYAPILQLLRSSIVLAIFACKQLGKLLINRSPLEATSLLKGIVDGLLSRTGMISNRPIIAFECESLEDTSWGTARQLRGLLTEFVKLPEVRAKYEVRAYFKRSVPDEPWLKHTHVRAIVVSPARWLSSSFSIYFYVMFPIRCWFDRPQVAYIANYMLPVIFIGKSIVMLTEDVWYEMKGSFLPFRYRIAYRIFSTWAAYHATKLMAITHASAHRIRELFAIDPDRIFVNELAVSEPIEAKPIASNYIVYIGQGLPRRHLRETLLAFEYLAPLHPGLSLRIVGPDKYQPHIVADLVDKINTTLHRKAVHWVERVNDAELRREFAGARLLIYVSDMEAFGLPPLEALTYGVPSVLLDAPVHREVFNDAAFYTSSASLHDITNAIQRGLTDAAHRDYIQHHAERITSRYTWNQHAKRMLAGIESIIS